MLGCLDQGGLITLTSNNAVSLAWFSFSFFFAKLACIQLFHGCCATQTAFKFNNYWWDILVNVTAHVFFYFLVEKVTIISSKYPSADINKLVFLNVWVCYWIVNWSNLGQCGNEIQKQHGSEVGQGHLKPQRSSWFYIVCMSKVWMCEQILLVRHDLSWRDCWGKLGFNQIQFLIFSYFCWLGHESNLVLSLLKNYLWQKKICWNTANVRVTLGKINSTDLLYIQGKAFEGNINEQLLLRQRGEML